MNKKVHKISVTIPSKCEYVTGYIHTDISTDKSIIQYVKKKEGLRLLIDYKIDIRNIDYELTKIDDTILLRYTNGVTIEIMQVVP